MVFDALLPEVLALVSTVEYEFNRLFVILLKCLISTNLFKKNSYICIGVKFNEQFSSFEAKFSNFSPGERRHAMKLVVDLDAQMEHGQRGLCAFDVLESSNSRNALGF